MSKSLTCLAFFSSRYLEISCKRLGGRTHGAVFLTSNAGYESFLFNLELHIRMYYLAACSNFRASVFIDIIYSYFIMGGEIHSFSASMIKTCVWRSEYSFSGSKDIP